MKRLLLVMAGIAATAGCSGQVRNRSACDLKTPSVASPVASVPAGEPNQGDFDEFEAEFSQTSARVPDPLEGWNRVMFRFNDRLYLWVLKPVAQAYRRIAPPPVRIGIRNFFHNLATPVRFVSCFAQGKDDDAGKEFGRFMVNSTWGILGVADPAKHQLGLEAKDDEDMGQTLGVYGVDQGLYLVWPGLGPSTLRDSVGMVADLFLNPVTYVTSWEVSLGVGAVRTTNDFSFSLGDYEALKSAAIEPYSAFRDAYLQYRAKQIQE
jgi:phospholipid-binding lipoprotein MlaA